MIFHMPSQGSRAILEKADVGTGAPGIHQWVSPWNAVSAGRIIASGDFSKRHQGQLPVRQRRVDQISTAALSKAKQYASRVFMQPSRVNCIVKKTQAC
jgi:hypothetical protein